MTRPCASLSRELYETRRYIASTPQTQDRSLNNDADDADHTRSHSPVIQMIQYARERSLVAGEKMPTPATPVTPTDGPCLTFDEFCVFAAELKRCHERGITRARQSSRSPQKDALDTKKPYERKISKSGSKCEVFLGGSCNPTTWRQEIAIPALKNLGITYYNPQVSHWAPELMEQEHQAKQNAALLFFVIDRQTRSVASIVEAAYLAACHRKLVLVIQPLDGPGQLVSGEPITQQEYEDIKAGQAVLKDLLNRIEIPVFSSVTPALDCTAKVLRGKMSLHDVVDPDENNSTETPANTFKYKLIKLREAFDALDASNGGQLSFRDVCMAFRILTDRDLSLDDLRRIAAFNNGENSVNFDQFCRILAELWSNPTDNKFSWEALVDKVAALLQSVVLPVPRVLSWASAGLSKSSATAPDSPVAGFKDVYLGGSCGTSAWREQIAIPLLKKSGLSFFNPQIGGWDSRLLPTEALAIDSSRVLLFVVTGETRSLSTMALAAHYIGLGYNVVLCLQYLMDNCEIHGEKLTRTAIKDYNRGRSYLWDLAKREGIPAFDDVSQAVECAIQRCKQQQHQQR